jgi:predicted nucleic acid-binding protein
LPLLEKESVSVKIRVLDSWPILEWMNSREPAAGLTKKLFAEAEQGRTQLFMSAMNVGEVYYFLCKQHSRALGEFWRESSATLPATIEVPAIDDIWRAASLKAHFPIAYADAFAAALAQKYNCPLVTGDPEFRSVDRLQLEWVGGK